jgi:hypothetical protein
MRGKRDVWICGADSYNPYSPWLWPMGMRLYFGKKMGIEKFRRERWSRFGELLIESNSRGPSRASPLWLHHVRAGSFWIFCQIKHGSNTDQTQELWKQYFMLVWKYVFLFCLCWSRASSGYTVYIPLKRLELLDTTRSVLAEVEFSCPLLMFKLRYARLYHVQCQNQPIKVLTSSILSHGINWWPPISLLVVPQVLNSCCF